MELNSERYFILQGWARSQPHKREKLYDSTEPICHPSVIVVWQPYFLPCPLYDSLERPNLLLKLLICPCSMSILTFLIKWLLQASLKKSRCLYGSELAHTTHAAHGATHASHWGHTSSHTTHRWHAAWGRHDGGGTTSVHAHTWEHHAHVHAHVEGTAGGLLGLNLLLLLNVLGALLDTFDLKAHVTDELDEVGHNVLLETAPPADLHSDVRLDQLVAVVEHGGDELLVLTRHDEAKQLLSESLITRLAHSLHSILIQVVLLGELDRLVILLVLSVKKRSDATALKKLMVLKSGSEIERLKAVVLLDGGAELLEVLVLEVDLIEGLIDSTDVLRLNRLKEANDEGDVASALHDRYGLCEVKLLTKQVQKVTKEHRLLLKVEEDSLVPELLVGNIDDVGAEDVVLPGGWRVLHHGEHSLILLLVDAVEEDSLSPLLVALALTDQSWDHDLAVEGTDEVHQLATILGVHDTQGSEDTLVGPLQVLARLKK